MVTMAERKEALQHSVGAMNEALMNLKVNWKKTKVMRVARKREECPVMVGEEQLQHSCVPSTEMERQHGVLPIGQVRRSWKIAIYLTTLLCFLMYKGMQPIKSRAILWISISPVPQRP